MTRAARRRAPLLLLVSIALCLPLQAVGDKSENPQQALEALDSSIGKIRKEQEKDQATQASLSRKLKNTEQEIAVIGARLRKLREKIDTRNGRLDEYRQERKQLARSLQQHHEKLSRQARASYVTGRQEFFKLLFNQEDPARVGRVLGYYRYYHRARLDAMATVREDIGRLEILEEKINTELAELEALASKNREHQAELQQAGKKRATLLGKLESRIKSRDARLGKLLKEKQQLENLIADLVGGDDVRFSEGTPFAKRKGKLGWPTHGKLGARYGQARLGGMKWQGIVIRASEGQEVRAVARGKVAFADWLPGYGMVLIIEHGGDYLSLYGYNQSLLKDKGDWVETGEAIATVGNSGGQDASGLYFEIRHKGRASNPSRWLNSGARLAKRP